MKRISTALLAASLAGCSLAPAYQVPQAPVEDHYVGADGIAWTQAKPADELPREGWWSLFGDAQLNALEQQAASGNFNLQAAEARYRQARAIADAANAGLLPTLGVSAGVTRERTSANAPTNISGTSIRGTDYLLRAQANYELDLWGRVRNGVAAARADAQAGAGDLAVARLSLQAELASDWFELRGLVAQQQLLASAVESYAKALSITQNRHEGGVSSEADVDQAQAQLQTARAQASAVALSRAQLEHAIALLLGSVPGALKLEPAPLDLDPPALAPTAPSQLLERRPDVAAAERRVAAANARIGVARAAWFPSLSLGAVFGFEGNGIASWIEAPSRFWSFGPVAALSLLDGGVRSAQNAQAIAAYDETAAQYKQTVIAAFGSVEDQLSAARWLAEQTAAQSQATDAATRALMQANNRYKGGIVNYLEVVTAQNTQLQASRALLDLRVRRLDAAVQLVKALGGGWGRNETGF